MSKNIQRLKAVCSINLKLSGAARAAPEFDVYASVYVLKTDLLNRDHLTFAPSIVTNQSASIAP